MSQAVRRAFRAVDRRDFLPLELRPEQWRDEPLPIGEGQTNSQPSTVRAMLELLELGPGMSVLDLGSGSGWTTALLAELVGPTGRVIGVERIDSLLQAARAALADRWPQAELRLASPGLLGAPESAPFDRILVSAGARRLPGQLVEQLAIGGLMVIPVAGVMTTVRRLEQGVEVSEHGSYVFVPLIED